MSVPGSFFSQLNAKLYSLSMNFCVLPDLLWVAYNDIISKHIHMSNTTQYQPNPVVGGDTRTL